MNDGSIKNKQDPGCKKILTLLGLSVMSAVKVKVKIRRIMRFQSPVQDFSRAAADLMYSSQWCFLNHTYIIFPHCHLMLYEHKCTVKDELFRNPRSRKVSACYFEQPIFSNISKMMHFICL